MVKPSSSSKICSPKPLKFFKVYLPNCSSQQMKIPPTFSKYLTGVIPFKAILTSSSRTWRVNVKEFNGHVVFDEDWPVFVKDFALESEDFLVFTYNGDFEFQVAVYGQNQCKKEATNTMETDNLLACEPEDIMSTHDNNDETTGHFYSPIQIQENSRALELSCNFAESSKQAIKDKGGDIAEPSKSVTKHPFFESILCRTYVHNFMHIPTYFWQKNMEKHSGMATIQYSNKSWSVMLKNSGMKLKFSGGWPKFVKDNNLQVGDVCYFELIDSENNVFKARFN